MFNIVSLSTLMHMNCDYQCLLSWISAVSSVTVLADIREAEAIEPPYKFVYFILLCFE